ncbi:hypothetical protein [Actinoplanes sp. NPDC049118]|uniref:hypothetical protein n=1 Tax=Actinoplanes sp. NPDC049118 TaxID=3155769 RepID=UPI0033C1E53F
MDRGPMALFGAIVAVGLGPAMWLGAQFGQVTQTPDRPPAVTTVQQNSTPRGGTGAGDAPTDTEVIDNEPGAGNQSTGSTRTARPEATKATPSPSESDGSPTPPVESSPTPSNTTGAGGGTPTEPTTPPDDPPTEDEPDVPPSPPSDAETGQVYAEASTA